MIFVVIGVILVGFNVVFFSVLKYCDKLFLIGNGNVYLIDYKWLNYFSIDKYILN